MTFFGVIFIISTTLVLIFKKEDIRKDKDEHHEESLEENLSVKQTYRLMWKLVWLPPIKTMILIMMTVKVKY